MRGANLRTAVLVGTLGFLAVSAQAQAASTCSGTMRASLVHPLPAPLVVGASRRITDAPNPELARRFTEGLRKAGVAVSEQPNATLSIAVSVRTAPHSRVQSGSYNSLEWMSGVPGAPDAQAPGLQAASLSISAVLADKAQNSQSWVATIDCKVQTDDAGTLAQFMGETIGRAIGKQIDGRPI